MSTVTHEPSTVSQWQLLRELRDLWASLAITMMWVAVVVVSLFGPDIRAFDVSGSNTTLPSGVVLAFFATIGTWSVAKYGFARRRHDA
jgi:hypothetical protein